MSNGACCAHMHVSYRTKEVSPDHLVSGWWECDSGCGRKFAPAPSEPAVATNEDAALVRYGERLLRASREALINYKGLDSNPAVLSAILLNNCADELRALADRMEAGHCPRCEGERTACQVCGAGTYPCPGIPGAGKGGRGR